MTGARIEESKRAMQVFLQSLTTGVPFNIIKFGDWLDTLWPECRPFDDETLVEAREYITRADADMSGTRLLPVLEFALNAPV